MTCPRSLRGLRFGVLVQWTDMSRHSGERTRIKICSSLPSRFRRVVRRPCGDNNTRGMSSVLSWMEGLQRRSDVSGKREELSELAWHGELPRKEIAHSRDRDVEN